MASNDTENYGLCQWEATDQVLRTEFNENNAKIDKLLSEHGRKLDWIGTCRIETGSYVGTGTYGKDHPMSFTFSGPPIAMLIYGTDYPGLFMKSGYGLRFQNTNDVIFNVQVDGNTISWWYSSNAGPPMNAPGCTYHYLAFIESV